MANRPTPSHLKVVKGTQRKDRANQREPMPEGGAPVCPAHLSDEAKVQWGRFSVQLEGIGVLTQVDGAALEQLVELYLQANRLRAHIKQHGELLTVTTTQKESVLKPNPACAMLESTVTQLRHYLIEFGLTPAARTKVHTVGQPKSPQAVPAKPAEAYF